MTTDGVRRPEITVSAEAIQKEIGIDKISPKLLDGCTRILQEYHKKLSFTEETGSVGAKIVGKIKETTSKQLASLSKEEGHQLEPAVIKKLLQKCQPSHITKKEPSETERPQPKKPSVKLETKIWKGPERAPLSTSAKPSAPMKEATRTTPRPATAEDYQNAIGAKLEEHAKEIETLQAQLSKSSGLRKEDVTHLQTEITKLHQDLIVLEKSSVPKEKHERAKEVVVGREKAKTEAVGERYEETISGLKSKHREKIDTLKSELTELRGRLNEKQSAPQVHHLHSAKATSSPRKAARVESLSSKIGQVALPVLTFMVGAMLFSTQQMARSGFRYHS